MRRTRIGSMEERSYWPASMIGNNPSSRRENIDIIRQKTHYTISSHHNENRGVCEKKKNNEKKRLYYGVALLSARCLSRMVAIAACKCREQHSTLPALCRTTAILQNLAIYNGERTRILPTRAGLMRISRS